MNISYIALTLYEMMDTLIILEREKHHCCIVSYPAIKIIIIKTSVIVGSQNNKSTKRKNRELIQVGN